MGRRTVCDPFDAALILERITKAETTAADAWRAYAATAARPCARATFAAALSRARARTAPSTVPVEPTPDSSRSGPGLPIAGNAMRNLKRGVSGHEIRKPAGAGPVLVIGPDAALRVRGGALDANTGRARIAFTSGSMSMSRSRPRSYSTRMASS
jgi:hypothetical protein